MDSALESPSEEAFQQALALAPQQSEQLLDFLEQEFQALKQRELDAFEAIQPGKTEVLQSLSTLAEWCSRLEPAPEVWQGLRPVLLQCRENHLRNIQLLQRQLEAVRGSLQALQGEAGQGVDLYDRAGRVSRRYAAWSRHLA